jgi:hypothetical protein
LGKFSDHRVGYIVRATTGFVSIFKGCIEFREGKLTVIVQIVVSFKIYDIFLFVRFAYFERSRVTATGRDKR